MGLKEALKIDLDERILNAFLEINAGNPFIETLKRNRLTHVAVLRNLSLLRTYDQLIEDIYIRRTLEQIAKNPEKLFLINESYLMEDYQRVESGKQKALNPCLYHHIYNRQFLAFYGVISTLPRANIFLGEHVGKDLRDLLISEILGDPMQDTSGIPINHRRFFNERHLGNLMHYNSRLKPSPQNIWELIDGYYMRKTGDSSLFDQTQKSHLPDIEKTGWGRVVILDNPDLVASRVYDILTRRTPREIAIKLSSLKRKTVIEGLDDLAESEGDMTRYFRKLELGGAMVAGFQGTNKNSPKAIYAALDYQYCKLSGDEHSLFDMSKPDFSPLMDMQAALLQPKCANKIIYDKLVRRNPEVQELSSLTMEDATDGIKKLPHNLTVHLREQGFRMIINRTYLRNYPLAQAVVMGYANHLNNLTHGAVNLLEDTQPGNIKFDKRGTLIRS